MRYFALGIIGFGVAEFAGVSVASVSRILRRVSYAITMKRDVFIRMPKTNEGMTQESKKFYDIAQFPRVIGVIGCTHIKIQSPGGDEADSFRNSKAFFSINTQAVCTADMTITNIVASSPGGSHDQNIFDNSNLSNRFESGEFDKFILIGDAAYKDTKYMATPAVTAATNVVKHYNESHERTRKVIERTFDALKQRFPVLALGMRVDIATVKQIIVACAVLHNIAVSEKDILPANHTSGFKSILNECKITAKTNEKGTDDNVRDNFLMCYFSSKVNGSNGS